jgi:shikimate kinase
MNLLLIGYRGAGKTTVARQLALRLGWDWVDSDVEIELRAGRSVAAIFAEDAEAAFRKLESQLLAELIRRERTVLALGGGVVTQPENLPLLAAAGPVVWLKAQPETLHRRLADDPATAPRRPDLTVGGLAEIRALLAHRSPLYRKCAALEVDTDQKTPAEIVEQIIAEISRTTDLSGR